MYRICEATITTHHVDGYRFKDRKALRETGGAATIEGVVDILHLRHFLTARHLPWALSICSSTLGTDTHHRLECQETNHRLLLCLFVTVLLFPADLYLGTQTGSRSQPFLPHLTVLCIHACPLTAS